jgi:nucleoside-diphosphate-sugar epimerase
VAAVVKAVCSTFEGNLNIGTGILTPTPLIAEILREIIGGKNNIDYTNIDSETACIAMDSSKAHEILGWKSNINLKKGLEYILSHA